MKKLLKYFLQVKGMLKLVFSLDYEIYGSGQGDFNTLMIEPTDRLLALLESFDAKLTIMVEVAEILALKNNREFSLVVEKIERQLKRALVRGHDIQLHIHPAWFNATYSEGGWQLDFDEYALVKLSESRVREYIHIGKKYLEELGQEVCPDYRCVAYRAGNWLMQPSKNVVKALEAEGLLFDTSVFKYGHGNVEDFTLDYREAESEIFSWRTDPENISNSSGRSNGLREVPIFTRKVFIASMLTLRRVMIQRRLRLGCAGAGKWDKKGAMGSGKSLGGLRFFFPKKFDFCRLNYREMRGFLKVAERYTKNCDSPVPVVAIGHSTEFKDDGTLKKFLEHAKRKQVGWTTFSEMALEK